VAGRTGAPPQGLNVNNLLLRPCPAPQRYFFPSLLKGFQKVLLADKIVAAFVRSTVLLLASATWMDHGWPCFTFVLYPVQFILHRNYAMWSVTCEHSEPATKSSQLSISSAANLLTSVCKNFSKIVGEVFNSGQRMVKTVLVHILHLLLPWRLMMEWNGRDGFKDHSRSCTGKGDKCST
jgi:hypothetical protein